MADSATEIDLDSVIDRLLEGGWRVPVTRSSFGVARKVEEGGGCKCHENRPRWGVLRVVLREGLGRLAVETPAHHAAVLGCAGAGRWKSPLGWNMRPSNNFSAFPLQPML